MKKVIVIVLLLLALFATAVIAADDQAIEHSQACDHASQTGIEHASDNSVLASCRPPPCNLLVDPLCVPHS